MIILNERKVNRRIGKQISGRKKRREPRKKSYL